MKRSNLLKLLNSTAGTHGLPRDNEFLRPDLADDSHTMPAMFKHSQWSDKVMSRYVTQWGIADSNGRATFHMETVGSIGVWFIAPDGEVNESTQIDRKGATVPPGSDWLAVGRT